MLGKKGFTVLLLSVLLAFTAACGNSASPAATSTAKAGAAQPSASAAAQTAAPASSTPQATPAPAQNAKAKKDIVLGAGSLGGAYYTIGAAMGDLIQKTVKSAERVSIATGTSNAFLPQMQEGKVDIALATPDTMYFAWSGAGGQGFEKGKRYDKVRFMGAFHINIMDMIVLDKSPIKKIEDIGTKKIGVIAPSLQGPMEEYMKAHGIQKPNVVVIANWNQMTQALRDGSISAIQGISTHPIPAITELAVSEKLRLLEASNTEAVNQFLKGAETQFFQTVTQKAGAYDFQKQDYHTVGRGSTVVVSADLPDDQVYEMTKTIYDNVKEIAKVHPEGSNFTIEMLQTYLDAGVIKIPFHPGARKYFEEKGLKIPASVPQP